MTVDMIETLKKKLLWLQSSFLNWLE
jgi:hypothetical protein